jgi:hypothetical protein
MKCAAAPFFGSDVGDGLGEVPAVAVKVLSVVLALAIGLVLGFRQDDGTVLSRSLTVPLSTFLQKEQRNTNEHLNFCCTPR